MVDEFNINKDTKKRKSKEEKKLEIEVKLREVWNHTLFL